MQVKYITETEEYGRKRYQIDLPRFAADIAKELGGKLMPAGDYPNEHQAIMVGSDQLDLRADNHKRRINCYANAPEIAWGDWSTYDKAQATESASVNPDGRSIGAIAKDLKKRVLDANQKPLAARRAYAVAQRENRASIVKNADALKAKHPGLDIRVNEREQTAQIYSGATGHYVSARMSHSGEVSIDRIGSFSAEAFGQILAILDATGKRG